MHKMHYSVLTAWLSEDPSLKVLCDKRVQWISSNIRNVLIPFIVHDRYVSKRLIYWMVSKYAHTQNIHIVQSSYITNVSEQYETCLRDYNRKLFDVFCRQPYLIDLEMRLDFDTWREMYEPELDEFSEQTQRTLFSFMDGLSVVRTTLAQLNFFYWASKQGILTYIKTYKDNLLREMKSENRRKRVNPDSEKRHKDKRARPSPSLVVLCKSSSLHV